MPIKNLKDLQLGKSYWLLVKEGGWKSLARFSKIESKWDAVHKKTVCSWEFSDLWVWTQNGQNYFTDDYAISEELAPKVEVYAENQEPSFKTKEKPAKDGCKKCGGTDLKLLRTALMCRKCGVVGGF